MKNAAKKAVSKKVANLATGASEDKILKIKTGVNWRIKKNVQQQRQDEDFLTGGISGRQISAPQNHIKN